MVAGGEVAAAVDVAVLEEVTVVEEVRGGAVLAVLAQLLDEVQDLRKVIDNDDERRSKKTAQIFPFPTITLNARFHLNYTADVDDESTGVYSLVEEENQWYDADIR